MMSVDDEPYPRLRSHLEGTYEVTVERLSPLQRGNPYVHRVDRAGGGSWVARLFPAERSLERVRGDAEILRHLEATGYPAERLAHENAVSILDDGSSVLVTHYLGGSEPDRSLPSTQGALADLLGRLAALPCEAGAPSRNGGAWGGDPNFEGLPRQDIAAALSRLGEVDGRVPAEHQQRYDSLRRQLEHVHDLDGLPEALLHPDAVPVNARLCQDGSIVLIDWTSAGKGPRIAALGWLLGGVSAPGGGYDEAKLVAVVDGYASHVKLEADELAHLPDAMRLRGLLFACLSFSNAIAAGKPPSGPGQLWCTDEDNRHGHLVADAIRARLGHAGG